MQVVSRQSEIKRLIMKDDEYPVIKIWNQIRRYAFVMPLCIALAFFSTFPFSYGIAYKETLLALVSGFVLVGSLSTLIIWSIWESRMSDKMLKTSAAELAEMEEGLSLLQKPTPNKLLH